jgi:hypothetical protein
LAFNTSMLRLSSSCGCFRSLASAVRRLLSAPIIILAIVILVDPFFTGSAAAFVRAVNQEGLQIYWPTSCANATVYLNGFAGMTRDEVASAVGAAAYAWSTDNVSCGTSGPSSTASHPYFDIVTAISASTSSPKIALDNENVIVFETTSWDFDQAAVAVTTHSVEPSGQIVDTDMEINATASLGLVWANLEPDSPPPHNGQDRIDLQTALTHEFGHFIGLAHTCYGGSGGNDDDTDLPANLQDDEGQPIPNCDDTSSNPTAVQAVMWFQVATEMSSPTPIAKRMLSLDDVRAVCAVYPAFQNPGSCVLNTPDDGCGCHLGPSSPNATGAIVILFSVVLRWGRRRNRPPRRKRPE